VIGKGVCQAEPRARNSHFAEMGGIQQGNLERRTRKLLMDKPLGRPLRETL